MNLRSYYSLQIVKIMDCYSIELGEIELSKNNILSEKPTFKLQETISNQIN
jgi:hypothetical protein